MPGVPALPRRPWTMVAAALVLAVVASVSGCSAPEPTPPATRSESLSGAPSPTVDPAALAGTLTRLLAQRDAALTSGDVGAFTATVADPTSSDGRRQVEAFRAALALRVTDVGHRPIPVVADPGAVDVGMHYRVAGVDRADRTSTVRYAFVRVGATWRVADVEPTGADAAPPWLAMPGLTVRRGRHAVVAGTAGPDALETAVRIVDRALPALAREWPRTPDRTLVVLPGTEDEAAALRGSPGRSVGVVAGSTDGPVDAAGLATGDRVLIDPEAWRRLTPAGRDVVLTHELVHVAVRATLPGTAPAWITEGYADHVGYARAGLAQRVLAGPLLAAVRTGSAPTEIPSAAELDPTVGEIEVGYLAAWQVIETVVALRGEGAARALLTACTVRGTAAEAERACTAAMPRVLGIDRARLTARWQARLASLAG